MRATLLPPAAVAIAAAAVLPGALAGSAALVAAVVALQVALAYGVPASEPRTDRIRTGVLALVAGVVAAIVLALNDGLDTATDAPGGSIGPIAYVVGPAVIVALLLQLARREHDRMVERLSTAVSAVALAGMIAAWVELLAFGGAVGDRLVLLAAGATLLCAFPGAMTDPGVRRGAAWWALKTLAVAGAATLVAVDPAGVGTGLSLAIGGAAAACGLVGSEVASRMSDTVVARAVLTPAVALAFAGPVAYLVTRIVLT